MTYCRCAVCAKFFTPGRPITNPGTTSYQDALAGTVESARIARARAGQAREMRSRYAPAEVEGKHAHGLYLKFTAEAMGHEQEVKRQRAFLVLHPELERESVMTPCRHQGKCSWNGMHYEPPPGASTEAGANEDAA